MKNGEIGFEEWGKHLRDPVKGTAEVVPVTETSDRLIGALKKNIASEQLLKGE